jgi:hypothetical protein
MGLLWLGDTVFVLVSLTHFKNNNANDSFCYSVWEFCIINCDKVLKNWAVSNWAGGSKAKFPLSPTLTVPLDISLQCPHYVSLPSKLNLIY